MSVAYDLLNNVKLPRMVRVRQNFDRTHIEREDIPERVHEEFQKPAICNAFHPGMEVAITCGSRGFTNTDIIIKSVADELRRLGCEPFVVPAMGSHGGASATTQEDIVRSYNVVPEFTGCEIRSSMDTVFLGESELGHSVYFDKNAYNADGVVVLNRIKAHTDFRGPYESGLMKMLAIGLGKQHGASFTHKEGFGMMYKNIPDFGKAMIKYAPITMGLAVLDNAYDQTMEIHALTPEQIISDEPALLIHSKHYLPRIMWDKCDVLIVDEMGKDISGAGMDPNVTGRFCTPYADGGIDAKRLAVLDFSNGAHGNFDGLGAADVMTRRLYNKLDYDAAYAVAITNTILDGCKIPMIMDSDKLVFQMCVNSANLEDVSTARIVRIKNTLNLDTIEISESMLDEALANPQIEILSDPYEIPFDENGNLF